MIAVPLSYYGYYAVRMDIVAGNSRPMAMKMRGGADGDIGARVLRGTAATSSEKYVTIAADRSRPRVAIGSARHRLDRFL
jgi:hypothetical protein